MRSSRKRATFGDGEGSNATILLLEVSLSFTCKATGEAINGGSFHWQDNSLSIALNTTQAPESCGVLYWDPLLTPLNPLNPTDNIFVLVDDGGEDPCFPSSANVTRGNGMPASMMDLHEGDSIFAVTADGTLTTDTLSTLSISRPEMSAREYVKLTTDAGVALTLTGEHHLPVGAACCSKLKKAKDVVVGDTVWVADLMFHVDKLAVPQKVAKTQIATEHMHGLYSPVLTHGSFPIVDGIVTSFDAIEGVTLASYGLSPLDRLCKATGTCGHLHRFIGRVFAQR